MIGLYGGLSGLSSLAMTISRSTVPPGLGRAISLSRVQPFEAILFRCSASSVPVGS